MNPALVLASGSPRRAELLARIGLHPAVRVTDVDETVLAGEAPGDTVVRLARAKAIAGRDAADRDVAGREAADRDEVVLAADTEVVLDGRVLGKPLDGDDAARMLRALSGRQHEVTTGLAAVRGGQVVTDRVTTTVRFRPLTDTEIGWYLATGEPAGKAGGYALQGAGAALVERLDGSDTNVIGLPLADTVLLLRAVGFEPLAR